MLDFNALASQLYVASVAFCTTLPVLILKRHQFS